MDDPRIASASVSDDLLTMHLEDGRVVSVPIAYYWRLADASSRQRQRFEILPNRRGIHWPDLDEDISIAGVLSGRPARRPDQVMTMTEAAERLGIASRTMRQTVSHMEQEGFRVGETRGRYRVLSQRELGEIAQWRQSRPPGRPPKHRPDRG